jgi:hypothetical protein
MRRVATLLLCSLSLVLAGCSGSAATVGPSAPVATEGTSTLATGPAASTASAVETAADLGQLPDPCTLLTADEVAGILGTSVDDGVADVGNSCKWEKSDPHAITVGLHLQALSVGLKCYTGGTPVSGLGADASWDYTQFAYTGSLVACLPAVQVQITLVGDLVTHTTTEQQLQAAGVQLMGLVIPRL